MLNHLKTCQNHSYLDQTQIIPIRASKQRKKKKLFKFYLKKFDQLIKHNHLLSSYKIKIQNLIKLAAVQDKPLLLHKHEKNAHNIAG